MTATAVLTRPAPRSSGTRARHTTRSATAVAFPAAWGPWRQRTSPRTRLRVVPARTKARRRRRTVLSASAAVVVLLTVVSFHALLAQSQVALDRLEQRTAAAERRYEEARYEYARLASATRITERAEALGLVLPAKPPEPVLIDAEEVPPPPDAPSTTLNGWIDVKPTLGSGP